jgi:putative SOS response-associated peptidase YedK
MTRFVTLRRGDTMCGRISLSVPAEEIEREFDVPTLPLDFRPRYNIAPSQPVLAVVADGSGGRRAEFFRWGLVPFWAKDPSIGNRMINARAETVAEKPAFRNALKRQRCLVPVNGFYEWQKQDAGKVPLWIHLTSGSPFALAGLWEEWRPSTEAAPLRSCTILTTAATEFMRPIHDRMPVIVPRGARDAWLDPGTDAADLLPLLAPYTGSDLDAYPVSTMVNSPANDLPECLVPV